MEVTVTTTRPWPAFPWFLYLDGRFRIEAPAQLDSPDCASKLIGTGPFKLDHWTVNQELVANKNPDYWQKDSKGTQFPYLDKITFKPIAEAGAARQLAAGWPARPHAHLRRPAGRRAAPAHRAVQRARAGAGPQRGPLLPA